jgi:hypothetical protein
MQHEFASEFGIHKLAAILKELGCSEADQTRLFDWYWKHAKNWNASSQSEFNDLANANLTVEYLRPAIRGGTKKSIPAKMRSRRVVETATGQHIAETQIPDDAEQDAWLHLLEAGTMDPKSAYTAGITAGHEGVRSVTRELPMSQRKRTDADSETSESLEGVAPWDQDKFDSEITRYLHNKQEDRRKDILRQFREEHSDDYEFIVNYVDRQTKVRFRRGRIVPVMMRGARISQADRNRARTIIDKLRRMDGREYCDSGDEDTRQLLVITPPPERRGGRVWRS